MCLCEKYMCYSAPIIQPILYSVSNVLSYEKLGPNFTSLLFKPVHMYSTALALSLGPCDKANTAQHALSSMCI